MVFPQNVGAPS